MSSGANDIHRVTVRGRFVDLTPHARALLESHAADHDIFSSAFTDEGTLTYDDQLTFFNMRFEIRDGAGEAEAHAVAIDRATAFLKVLDIGFVLGRVASMNMSEMAARTNPEPDG